MSVSVLCNKQEQSIMHFSTAFTREIRSMPGGGYKFGDEKKLAIAICAAALLINQHRPEEN